MIHLTVALPEGLDSSFFSFVQRLADMNEHQWHDDSSQDFDSLTLADLCEQVAQSKQHYFLLGYRYPPQYWRQLAEHAETIVVLADGDGVARQVESILEQKGEAGDISNISSILEDIRIPLESILGLVEMCCDSNLSSHLVLPIQSFMIDPLESFRRLESFYRLCGVPCDRSCWEAFGKEATPYIAQLGRPRSRTRQEIHRFASLGHSTPERLVAARCLFGDI